MSFQVKVTLLVATAVKVHTATRNRSSTDGAVEELANMVGLDSDSALGDVGRAVVKAMNSLPCDIVAKNTTPATNFDTASVGNPITAACEITVTVRDAMMREELICMWDNETVDDLIEAYARRCDTTTDKFFLTFNDKVFSSGLDIYLTKVGIVDESVVRALPKADATCGVATTASSAVLTPRSPQAPCSNQDKCFADLIASQSAVQDTTSICGAGASTVNITVTVRDLMMNEETICLYGNPTVDDLFEAYANRIDKAIGKFYFSFGGKLYYPGLHAYLKKAGMVDGSMIHALPNVAGWATSRLTSPVNTPPSNAPVDVVNFFRPGSVTPTNIGASQSTITDDDKIEITIRDLMNQLEHFSISRNDSLEKLADWYSDRTGLEASGLRFKFPDGRVRCVDWDDGETLEDLGISDGEVIVAMPESIRY
ncbi:hypothetical protein LTR37_016422 [Vermiconidia calcicola]|uniref:Uncharacterized protein n=1 Tax=Vermiconidia calcicola TaxID=1690605 RepID=A0ACC3MPA6_9PEZI|nr:hypothetical protein LTR37_016422 [Vermiconidia calcicola]